MMIDDKDDILDDHKLDDDKLDALIAQARWPELDVAAQSRLRATIRRESPHSAQRLWLRFALTGAAASVALGAGGWLAYSQLAVATIRSERAHHTPRREPMPKDAASQQQTTPRPGSSAGRPPNIYEQLILASAKSKTSGGTAVAVVPADEVPNPVKPSRLRDAVLVELRRPANTADARVVRDYIAQSDLVDRAVLRQCLTRPDVKNAAYEALLRRTDEPSIEMILQLVLDAQTRDAVLAGLSSSQRPPVDALIDRLSGPDVQKRFAAARALGAIDDAASLSRLQRMAQSNDHRREALAALLSSATPTAQFILDQLVRRDPSIIAHVLAIRGELRTIFS
jgi:DNA-binding protein Fis